MTHPSLSVLMPFRNEAARMEEALQSLAEQTRDDFEVVMVNDRSDDGSTELAQGREAENNRFRLLRSGGWGVPEPGRAGGLRALAPAVEDGNTIRQMPPDAP
ncbi:glycosyltransferase [Candidatus Fermentibacteria bacterium]|nr:glycosyltransferase [Candidatus Fermentibacteria bacterium]